MLDSIHDFVTATSSNTEIFGDGVWAFIKNILGAFGDLVLGSSAPDVTPEPEPTTTIPATPLEPATPIVPEPEVDPEV
ncbi:hypothetical protein NYP18_08920 [Corynebacterium sp. YIM 101645]|uniref:Uncharacterized protein n=1 Tax=Corynebacterium lemuris TaxID=1859292 RepID=A0ABT2FYB4_9CORY|nr:hypothetical protein [Corynebacterium lemuris]MCS5479780.1 hypothetical protein [Corynebacterium lemuris]